LKHIGALRNGLTYLSRYNSGWFCHMDIPPTTRNLVFHTHRRVGVCSAQRTGVRSCSRATDVHPAHWMCVWSYSRLWWPWSTSRNERQMVALERSLDVPGMWVRFTLCKVMKLDSELSVSCGDWECLFLLPHRVRIVTLVGIILMDINLYLACLV
jgi:hypothetical protein